MQKYIFTGVAFVTNAKMIVEAETLGEAISKVARGEGGDVDLDKCEIEYSWADLNSGKEARAK